MGKLAGVPHLKGVRALEKAGLIPRSNPVDAYTMGGIIRDAGLTLEKFRELL